MISRRRRVPVGSFDIASKRWSSARGPNGEATSQAARDELTLATFNVWFSDYHAEERYRAVADVMARKMPDVMVFQEVTPAALAIFLAQPWIRVRYRRAEVTGGGVGNYGMLLLSRSADRQRHLHADCRRTWRAAS